MVTRSEAIERMAIGLVPSLQVVLDGGPVPSTPTTFDRVKAAAALDALLDYLEETIDGDFEFMDSSGRTQVAPIREALLFRDLLPVLRGEAKNG